MIQRGKWRDPHILRQVFATFVSCLLSVSVGLTFGYSGVLLPQLKNDPDFPYDEDLDSWIASISPLLMMIGCLIAGGVSDAMGRKNGQLIVTPIFALGWIVMGFAKDNTIILLGRLITGICTGAARPCSMVYIGEITSPKYRSITLLCPTLAINIGTIISHVLGGKLYWRTGCFAFALPNIMGLIILTFLTESPLWLIEKGRMEEGLKSFKLFRGDDEAAEKELISILEKQNEKLNESSIKDLFQTIFSRIFMKTLATTFFLLCAGQLCGVNMISFYTLTLFESLFGNTINPNTLTLIIDFLVIVVAVLVCFFANTFPRRITFLICCFFTALLLVLLSVYFFIEPPGLSGLGLVIFTIYVMVGSCVTTLSWPYLSEIFPNKLRGFGSGLGTAFCSIQLFVCVIITPGILHSFGNAILFAIFFVITSINFVILVFILPETSGKTLQDIENSLYGKKDSKLDQETNITRL